MAKQLLLNIKLNDHAHFENFYFTENALTVHTLKKLSHLKENFIYLWGQKSVGKTHLLQACCHTYQNHHSPIIYIPLKQHRSFSLEILKGLHHIDLVCLDDVDVVSTDIHWAEALFHCYNSVQQYGKKLIVSASASPKQLPCVLPDLQSRYNHGLTLTLEDLSDIEKIQAIQMRIKNRGLVIHKDVVTFLINHYPRDLKALFNALDQLEEISLRQQRRITIPLIKKWLSTHS
jgi:DnaA family protein